jgi:lipopolysaccharide/colanic/teichoic acid biosynthesis glycosyltransferase
VRVGSQTSLTSSASELEAQRFVLSVEEVAPTPLVLRALDVALSSLLLTVLLPLFALIAVAIRLDSPGPVLFRQRRCGLGFEQFTLNKFRTMHCGAVAEPHREYVLGLIRGEAESSNGTRGLYKLEVDERVTRVGRLLRRFSLDELPQLVNILLGHMALVGPRPPIPYEVENYPPEWLGRLAVKPGLTGLWQVSGRNELSYDEMVQLDLEYVVRQSLWLNFRILAKTLWVVLRGRGAV